ncbi:MAG TPA: endonuclease/exonuclease/phosphatase family protein [Candidatus Paceibacterota bacterium]|jgi:endonuclease/exonuclease/phosphatase family metal-dependent hydrolase|nr:endonuclease/exonuclease/phosphatase family protein [Candidatus Paceibacterota bacterium]
MHGRNKRIPLWPLWVGKAEVEKNLEKIADLVRTHGPEVVCLQEVDQGSVLSGSFDQFEFLKQKTGYPYGYFAPSCRVMLFDTNIFVSGQAILSKYPLSNCAAYKFPITFPTDRMGFVVADVQLPGWVLTVASVHLTYLDWQRRDVRGHQMELVERVVVERRGKAVIAGDFNCDLGKGKPTYPSWGPDESIDWVLGRGVAVESCKVLPDQVSDHLAVFAALSL